MLLLYLLELLVSRWIRVLNIGELLGGKGGDARVYDTLGT
jgi:hypothetical protein